MASFRLDGAEETIDGYGIITIQCKLLLTERLRVKIIIMTKTNLKKKNE